MATQAQSVNSARKRRVVFSSFLLGVAAVFVAISQIHTAKTPELTTVQGAEYIPSELASKALEKIQIKGRAPSNEYERSLFGSGWATVAGCDMRNRILARDLQNVVKREDGCVVLSGELLDPYTAKIILFTRGDGTSAAVQIDHVVALSDAWQKGAALMVELERESFANDPLNLLAVDGPTNVKKGDADAATWLPPNKSFRCRYVARQTAVKLKYQLWMTQAEHDAISRVLSSCPGQVLPVILQGTHT